jgi:cytochrome c-type biogenesis protein CcmH/NrfF
MSDRSRKVAWAALAVVVAVVLAVGTHRPGRPTVQQRASAIAAEVRCPACRGQSAELSDAPAAKAVREFILAQVSAGQGRAQIEQELEDRYGGDILLRPPASGVAGLVWVLPVVAVVIAGGALALAFRRWRAMTDAPVSDADRRRVAQELSGRQGAQSSGRQDAQSSGRQDAQSSGRQVAQSSGRQVAQP